MKVVFSSLYQLPKTYLLLGQEEPPVDCKFTEQYDMVQFDIFKHFGSADKSKIIIMQPHPWFDEWLANGVQGNVGKTNSNVLHLGLLW